MCGRFVLKSQPKVLADLFSLPELPEFLQPRYNVAPSQLVAVVGLKPDGVTRGLARLRWGLVPSWANGPNDGPRPINARGETVAALPTFRESFRSKRCLIPADGFYEWAKGERGKRPRLFRLADETPFAFAGLWDSWGTGRERSATCCIVTVAANDLVAPLHDRMPLILPPDAYSRWLTHETTVAELQSLLRPYPTGAMAVVPVGPAVNKVANDGPECITPVVP